MRNILSLLIVFVCASPVVRMNGAVQWSGGLCVDTKMGRVTWLSCATRALKTEVREHESCFCGRGDDFQIKDFWPQKTHQISSTRYE